MSEGRIKSIVESGRPSFLAIKLISLRDIIHVIEAIEYVNVRSFEICLTKFIFLKVNALFS